MRLKGNHDIYQLDDQPLKAGGEGSIYTIANHPDKVAKIYHAEKLSSELEDKLIFMAQNPPDQSIMNQIAWPQDLLRNAMGDFVGFVMPKLSIDTDLKAIYSYPPNPKIPITYEQKVIVAINICIVISAIHKAGYVFGDFNPLNIGINLKTGHVAFLDTDSYHITDTTSGKVYRCEVCLDGYVAPELIQKCKGTDFANAPLPTFTQETDRFALAIHIFKLLMNGYTPFNGIKEGESASQASPGVGNLAIERDNYCFKPGNKPQSVATPDLSAFSPDIQFLFKKTFLGGANAPEQRATADEWYHALCEYKDNLIQCKNNPAHYHYINCATCPYCDADQRYQQSMSAASGAYKSRSGASSGQVSFNNPVNIPQGGNQGAQHPKSQAQTQRQTKKPNIIGRVLLWIFFFPIMMIGAIGKNRKIHIAFRVVLIYLFISVYSVILTGGIAVAATLFSEMEEAATTKISVDIGKMAGQIITGYNNYGYFDSESKTSEIVTVDEKEYTLTLKPSSYQDKYMYFALMVDQGENTVGDASIRVKCNEYLSNDEVLTFEISEQIGSGYSVKLEHSTIRVSGLNTEEFIRHDPRDYFEMNVTRSVSDGWYKHDFYKFELTDSQYALGDKTIKLSVIDDPRPGADEVHPGLLFEVFNAAGELLGSGRFKFTEMKYDANNDDYGNVDVYGFTFEADFNQAELLGKTGILFINTAKQIKGYD